MCKTTFCHFVFYLTLFVVLSQAHSFQFNQNGEFTVLQFTDFHYGESKSRDQKTQDLQRRLLALVQPDLAIVSGDGVSGFAAYHFFGLLKNYEFSGFFKENWFKFTLPFKEANIPYAFLMGNHDAEADFNEREIIELEKTNPLSVLGMSEGLSHKTTYNIPIYSSQNSSQLAANIWMFDTGSTGCAGIDDTWGCIDEEQIAWYDDKSQQLKNQYGENVNHIAFLHIPIPEFLKARNKNSISGISGEDISCPIVNPGFFDHVKTNGDITAMFVGHDHDNDWEGSYDGIELIYGRKSGYGSYGKLHGAKVIQFKESTNANGELIIERTHYEIDENGVVVTQGTPVQHTIGQYGCIPEVPGILDIIAATGVPEYLQIAFMVIVTFALCFSIFKRIIKSHKHVEKSSTIIDSKGKFIRFKEEHHSTIIEFD